jgi:hypothetical protein
MASYNIQERVADKEEYTQSDLSWTRLNTLCTGCAVKNSENDFIDDRTTSNKHFEREFEGK